MKKNIALLFFYFFCFQIWGFVESFALPFTDAALLGFVVFSLLAYRQVGLLIDEFLSSAKNEAQLAALLEQQRLAEEQQKFLEQKRAETLAFRREALSHFQSLSEALSKKEYEKAKKSLPEMEETFARRAFHTVCENSLLNAILMEKKDLAEQIGARVTLEILLPEALPIVTTDLSSIFFNLMDNAIESCQASGAETPFLHLSTETAAGFLAIRMENSKDPDQAFTRRSSKSDSLEHGFGLSIIEEISQKYDGCCEWKDNGETFSSVVMLRYEA